VPLNGWQVDPALAYAHILQESNFRASARSPADAQGLMQITPITVRQHAPRLELNADQVDIYEPRTNLAFGQRNLLMLRDDPATRDTLPKIMAAYNAGLTPITPLEQRDQRPGRSAALYGIDPLLGNAQLCRDRDAQLLDVRAPGRAPRPAAVSLAQNAWPAFPGGGHWRGRVYLSPGRPAGTTDGDRREPRVQADQHRPADRVRHARAGRGHLGRHPRRADHLAGHRLVDAHDPEGRCRPDRRAPRRWIDDPAVDAIVSTGGTGLTGRDVTPEALDRVKTREIPGFGELFRMVSYQTIGTSTVQSRACAVVARWNLYLRPARIERRGADGWDGSLPSSSTAATGPATSWN
jgi:hypothetical protein